MKVVSNNNIICDSINIMDCQKPLGNFLMDYFFVEKCNVDNLKVEFSYQYKHISDNFSYCFESLLNVNKAILSITIIYIFWFMIINVFYKDYSIIVSYVYLILTIILYIILAIFLAYTSYYAEYGFKNGATLYGADSNGNPTTDIVNCNNNFECLGIILNWHSTDHIVITNVNKYYTGLDIVIILLPFIHFFILPKNIYDNHFEPESQMYDKLNEVAV